MKPVIVDSEEKDWEQHPLAKDVLRKTLVSKKEHNANVTCFLVKIKKGAKIPEHVHEQDDIIFVLSGKCKMWIENVGEIKLKEGMVVFVPRGTKHTGAYDVEEDIICFDIFNPATL